MSEKKDVQVVDETGVVDTVEGETGVPESVEEAKEQGEHIVPGPETLGAPPPPEELRKQINETWSDGPLPGQEEDESGRAYIPELPQNQRNEEAEVDTEAES